MNQHYWQVSFFSDPYRCLHSAVMFRIIIINSYNIVGLPHHIFRAFFIPFGSWVFWSHQHLGTALSEFSLPCLALWVSSDIMAGEGADHHNTQFPIFYLALHIQQDFACPHVYSQSAPNEKAAHTALVKWHKYIMHPLFYAFAWGHIFIVFEFEAGRVLTNHRTRTYFHLFFLQIFHLTIIIYAMVD